MLEAYTSEHPETVDEILDWPAVRAEAFLDAFQKRKVVEDLTWRKLAHTNALHSNSGYEGREGATARNEALERLDRQYEEAVDRIYGEFEEEEIDMDNPFFAHAYDGLPPLDTADKD